MEAELFHSGLDNCEVGVFAVPLLSTEMAIGKKARYLDALDLFVISAERNVHRWGFFVVAVCFFLMSYYCVLQGYCLKYAVKSVASFETNLTTDTTCGLILGPRLQIRRH